MIGKELYNILSNSQPVTDIVGENISPEVTNQAFEPPFIMYSYGITPLPCKGIPSTFEVNLTINTYSARYDQGQELLDALRQELWGKTEDTSEKTIQFEYAGEDASFNAEARIYHNEIKFQLTLNNKSTIS